MDVYLNLAQAVLIVVVLSLLCYIVERKTPFGRLPYAARQIIIGLLFGAAAVYGTEFGVDVGGATANARDAAPLCAGLIFGAPSGIIAGFAGGIERWFAASWGAGEYSQLACSVSTAFAGLYAAFLRKFMFDNRRPTAGVGFATGVVMEVIHLTLVFVTHLSDATKAFEIVKICTLPMIACNSFAVLISIFAVNLLGDGVKRGEKKYKKISQKVQAWLLASVVIAYFATTIFVYSLQTGTAMLEADDLLSTNLDDVSANIVADLNENLLDKARSVAGILEVSDEAPLESLADQFRLTEINIVNSHGIITKSNNPDFVGYDMYSGQQSRAFMDLGVTIDEYVQDIGNISYDFENDSLKRRYAGVKLSDGGFVQVGFDLQRDNEERLIITAKSAHDRRVGENGFIIIADSKHNIISSGVNVVGTALSDYGLSSSDIEGKEGVRFEKTVCGEKSFCMFKVDKDYYLIAVIPQSEVFYTRDAEVYINSYMEVLVFALFFLMVYSLIKKLVVNNIQSVNDSLGKIIGGNLEVKIDVRSSDEFASLSDDINTTVTTLKHYISEAAARIDKELEYAKNIQHSALPSVFPAYPNVPEFDIYATMNTAKEVGGDFYDFYMLGEDKLAFVVADVSGKGIPAAMFMMTAKTMLKNFAEGGASVNDVFTRANEKLCEENEAGMFVTAWMGILDIKTGHVCFANAGHNPPLIYRKGSGFEYLHSKAGFVLAGMDGVRYKMQEFDLAPGDKIFIYTDGVTEATDLNTELYGEKRLQEHLNANSGLSPEETLKSVLCSIDEFVGEAEQFDDITMLALEYMPKGSSTIMKEKEFDACDESLDSAMAFVEEALEDAECPLKVSMQISVATEEIFVNVAHYAYPDGNGKVTVGVGDDGDSITVRFTDSGIPFDPLEKKDPDITLSAEERNIGGLGIYMVKKSMDDVTYEYKDGKNILTFTKKKG